MYKFFRAERLLATLDNKGSMISIDDEITKLYQEARKRGVVEAFAPVVGNESFTVEPKVVTYGEKNFSRHLAAFIISIIDCSYEVVDDRLWTC